MTNKAQVKHLEVFGPFDYVQAHYETQTFSLHAHEEFVIGIIDGGTEEFNFKGSNTYAPTGSAILINPEEPHDGSPATKEPWRYRAIYPSKKLISDLVYETKKAKTDDFSFREAVVSDNKTTQNLSTLFWILQNPSASKMAKEESFLLTLRSLFSQHSFLKSSKSKISREEKIIYRVCNYIHDNFSEDITLLQLAEIAGFHPNYLIRVFENQTGLTPHRFLINVRLKRAKEMLVSGKKIVDAALDSGFYDQSHFHRLFKKAYGYTPNTYKKA